MLEVTDNAANTDTFLHIPPDLIKNVGKNWYLDLEKHPCEGILLFVVPECEGCSSMKKLLKAIQQDHQILVYIVTVWQQDMYSTILSRNLGLNTFPTSYHVDKKGKLTPWTKKYPHPDNITDFSDIMSKTKVLTNNSEK